MSSQQMQQPAVSAPYRPITWGPGGRTEKNIDVPIMAVFLVLFLGGIILHLAIFKRNWSRGHKFLFSTLLLNFCSARVITCILRICSTYYPAGISLLLATQVFVQAGVIPIYIVNLFFAQRIIRATHSHFGWERFFDTLFLSLLFVILFTLAIVIVVLVQTFFTLKVEIRRIDGDVDVIKYGVLCFAVVSFLPIVFAVGAVVILSRRPFESFGNRKFRSKVMLLLVGSSLILFGAAYRAGTTWLTPVSVKVPMPGYFCRAAFYVVTFTVEVLVIYMYAVFRMDQIFHTPEGSLKCWGYDLAREQRRQPDEKAHDKELE